MASSENENTAILLTGMLAGLLMREEIRSVLSDFSVTPTKNLQALTLYFPESHNAYCVDVRFVSQFANSEEALAAIESGIKITAMLPFVQAIAGQEGDTLT